MITLHQRAIQCPQILGELAIEAPAIPTTSSPRDSIDSDEVVSDAIRTVGVRASGRRFVELSIAASGLQIHAGWEVWAHMELCKADGERIPIGRTETLANDPSPNFVASFAVLSDSFRTMQQDVVLTVMRRLRRRGLQRQQKELVVGSSQFKLRDLLFSKHGLLDLPLISSTGELSGLVVISAEEFRSREAAPDMVSIHFEVDTPAHLPSTTGYFFVVSRELKSSPGHWNRVYRSSLVVPSGMGATCGSTEPTTVSCGSLFANDEARKMLIEFYRVSHPDDVPELCGSTETSVQALVNCLQQNMDLHMVCDEDGYLARGQLKIQPGTVLSNHRGRRNVIHLRTSGIRWFESDDARKQGRIRDSRVDRDSWGRQRTTDVEVEVGAMRLSKRW
eukprot:CAMPEP_0184678736 /NCGR_PEP_ID=MMETSP0312-20130426/1535_1 /TAXON_ID=31354 /ORGANISM="Compsopogon coeruleus, Strain SAG 36.94" /LENGTH=390 /DNA_ID=CAMNT_0027127713 /DNA_START=3222 /DNA_END=4391 /DNA_ORIENTATION=-